MIVSETGLVSKAVGRHGYLTNDQQCGRCRSPCQRLNEVVCTVHKGKCKKYKELVRRKNKKEAKRIAKRKQKKKREKWGAERRKMVERLMRRVWLQLTGPKASLSKIASALHATMNIVWVEWERVGRWASMLSDIEGDTRRVNSYV